MKFEKFKFKLKLDSEIHGSNNMNIINKKDTVEWSGIKWSDEKNLRSRVAVHAKKDILY